MSKVIVYIKFGNVINITSSYYSSNNMNTAVSRSFKLFRPITCDVASAPWLLLGVLLD